MSPLPSTALSRHADTVLPRPVPARRHGVAQSVRGAHGPDWVGRMSTRASVELA